MKYIALLFYLAFVLLYATEDEIADVSKTQGYQISLQYINQELKSIESKILPDNIWIERFQIKNEIKNLKKNQKRVEKEIKKLRRRRNKKSREKLKVLQKQKEIIKSQLSLLDHFVEGGYEAIYKISDPENPPAITNPIAILMALSYLKELNAKQKDHIQQLEKLKMTIKLLKEKLELLKQKEELIKFQNNEALMKKIHYKIETTKKMIDDFDPMYQIFSTTLSIYNKKVNEIKTLLNEKIKKQTFKLINVLIIIGIFIVFMFIIKLLIKKYTQDSEKIYIANRSLNIISLIIIGFIVIFNYITNITYILTILGFVSAGIAFAMKDWFTNILGWFVIVFGGYIQVGDRIRIAKGEEEYLGDVLEIGLTKIMLFEDVTLPAVRKNRRAGRIVFIPNSYIFTLFLQNYSFKDYMRTVWDGIDIIITFDSNHKKAAHLAREIVTKYAKGYTDITKKNVSKLKTQYNLKNSNVEPRIYTFIEKYGVRISSWYFTNSYATLTLRSRISGEIVEAFNKEDDITIAYPTTTINITDAKSPNLEELRSVLEIED